MLNSEDLIKRATEIRLMIFDVDGVLTDGGLFRTDEGPEIKRFHARDGLGMRMLMDSGVDIAIITGRTSEVVKHRATELSITHVYQGKKQKLPSYIELIEQLGLEHEQVAYMGDDLIDLPVLTRVGLAMAPCNAHTEVLSRSHWHSSAMPGNGAAREACELILQAQGKWQAILDSYLA